VEKNRERMKNEQPYFFSNHSFACTKCPFVKKPLCADKGDGCCDIIYVLVEWLRAQTKGKRSYDTGQNQMFLLRSRSKES
jgi:hypothetical protein